MAAVRTNGGVTAESTNGVCAFGFTATSGRLLIATMMERSGAFDSAHTATAGWTKRQGITQSQADATYRRSASVWTKASDGTETTVTIGDGTANSKRVTVEEFSGVTEAQFSTAAGTGNGTTANGDTQSSGNTASVSGDLFLYGAIFEKRSSATLTITGCTWTNGVDSANNYIVSGTVNGRALVSSFGEVAAAAAGTRETAATLAWSAGASNSGLMTALLVFVTGGGGGPTGSPHHYYAQMRAA